MSDWKKKSARQDAAASKHPAKSRAASKKSWEGRAEQSERGHARTSTAAASKAGKTGERSNFKKVAKDAAKTGNKSGSGAGGQVWARGSKTSSSSAPSAKSSLNKPPSAKLKAAGKNNKRPTKK